MAQKANPISVRLNSNYHSDSSWFSDYYYRELLYRDVDFKRFFRAILPRILSRETANKTKARQKRTGLKGNGTRERNRGVELCLGRCIIHHFPGRTFIHVFFFLVQRRPPLFFGRRHRRRRQSRLTGRRAVQEVKKLANRYVNKAPGNPSRPLTTAFFMPLVAQYYLHAKNQIHSDPTMVNIIDDNLLLLSPSLSFFLRGKDVTRSLGTIDKERSQSGKNKRCLYIANVLCEKAGNLCCQYYCNKDAQCECTKPAERDLCSNYSSSKGDVRWRLYAANARFKGTKRVCSHCCWKKIRSRWSEMQSFFTHKTGIDTLIKPVRVDFPYQSASLIAQEIAWGLEGRKSFVQICTSIFQEIENCGCVRGIRICCSGRLNGAEIAETEYTRYGSTSLHVFSDYIDYARAEAFTRYGILGVKVWLSYSKHILSKGQ